MPAVAKLAVVSTAVGSPKVTVPGPETFVQVVVSRPLGGRPSSVTVPSRLAVAGRVTVASGPALTTGAWLAGPWTVTTMSSLLVSAASSAVRRSV